MTMQPALYAEYVTHSAIPGCRAYVHMPRGKAMLLSAPGWQREFRTRRACIAWLAGTMPDALYWAFDNGVSVCGGTVGGLAERAGIDPEGELFA